MDKGKYGRKDRLIKEKRHDTYQLDEKLPEPIICKTCNAVFEYGHWTWKTRPQHANEIHCPACQRILDKYPAGFVEIKGPFFDMNREEVLNLIDNVEKQEKRERPLERIISIIDQKIHTLITTTGIHIARRIGEGLAHAYQGDFSFNYSEAEKCIRVYWRR